MNRMLIALLSLGMLASCSAAEEDDPYATSTDFCKAWADRACNEDVVDRCSQEPSLRACLNAQEDYCEGLFDGDDYRRAGAEECLKFVEKAYEDARLEAYEARVVLKLGAPCAQVTGRGGVLCDNDDDCERIDGAVCEEQGDAGFGICRIGGGRSCDDEASAVQCEADFYCDGHNCIERRDRGDDCTEDKQCGQTLRCEIPEDEEEGECVTRNDLEEECDTDTDCQSGFCAEERCVSRIYLTDDNPICEDLS